MAAVPPIRVPIVATPVGFGDLGALEDTGPRLRILPNLHGEPRHYLVLDRLDDLSAEEIEALVEGDYRGAATVAPILAFPFAVAVPEVDDDYRDGDEELVQWPQFVGGTRQLGPGLIGTAEGPGEPGSVLNWEGVNYVPQADPEPNGITAADRERFTDCQRCGQVHPDIGCPELEPDQGPHEV